jgi:hypothetical protein
MQHTVIAPSVDPFGEPVTTPLRVVSNHGLYITLLEPGKQSVVHESQFAEAIRLGCTVPGGGAVGQILSDEALNELLVDAMLTIIRSGDDSKLLLRQGGKPRFAFVKELVGEYFPMDLYENAWESVMDMLDASGGTGDEVAPSGDESDVIETEGRNVEDLLGMSDPLKAEAAALDDEV